ncbi:ATP-grasp domain-containing protein [Edaphovirga cremea]|uniref:ATP-grasp domain-containing protein n=1 Tax=Edaphovirga cremea TaxID=2267246 RepID=UPI000DEEEFC9|nr:hypothetical protein [Edaphovirga cremea]
MKEKIGVILSSFGLSNLMFHEYISECKERFILMTDKLQESNVRDFSGFYKEVYYFDNFDSNALVDKLVFDLSRDFNIDRVISIFEPDILRASYIRQALEIEGDRPSNIELFRDKVLMKEIASNGGCSVPAFKKIKMPTDFLSFIKSHSYPVFVKPISSCGSVGASAIRNEHDACNFLSEISGVSKFDTFNTDFQVEDFIDGKFHHVDGLVVNSEIVAKRIGKYSSNADLESINAKGYWSTTSLDKNDKRYTLINDFIQMLTLEFSKRKSSFFFHCEVFLKNDVVYLCEIACRAPGGGMALAWEYAFGASPFELCLELELQGHIDQSKLEIIRNNAQKEKLVSSICLLPLTGKFISSPKDCELDSVVHYKTNLLEGNYYYGGKYSGDTDCVMILEGSESDVLDKSVFEALSWYRANSIWEN